MSEPPSPDNLNLESLRTMSELEAPLGRFVMRFAHLEDRVRDQIGYLLRISPLKMWMLEAQLQKFSARIDLLGALYRHKLDAMEKLDEQARKRLEKSVKRCISLLHDANACRNNLVHDAWNISPDCKALSKVRLKIEDTKLKYAKELFEVNIETVAKCVTFLGNVDRVLVECLYNLDRAHDPTSWHSPLPNSAYERSPLHRQTAGKSQ